MRETERTFDVAEIDAIEAKGGNYRRFDEGHARRFLAEMEAGRWVQNHNVPIVLSRDGRRCLDGQHRLWAAREYFRRTRRRIRFRVMQARNADEELSISLTTDTGKPRRVQDHLRSIGAENITSLAAALRVAATLGDTDRLMAQHFDNSSGVSVAMMAAMYDRDRKGFDGAVSMAMKAANLGNFGYAGLLAAIAYLMLKKAPDAAELFFRRLGDGQDLSAGHPIGWLRNYLNHRKGEGARRSILRRAVIAAIVIKAWNAWVNGERPRLIKWAVNGEKSEDFPQIADVDQSLFASA